MDETKETRDGEAAGDVAHLERVVYRRVERNICNICCTSELADHWQTNDASHLGARIDRSNRADRGAILNRSLISNHGKLAPSQEARQGGSR